MAAQSTCLVAPQMLTGQTCLSALGTLDVAGRLRLRSSLIAVRPVDPVRC